MIRIAGVASIRPPNDLAWSMEELVFRAARAALDDAGLERDVIDGVCLGASDQLDGRLISSMHMAGPAGAYLRDEIKVGDDGAAALAAGALRLEAGVGKTMLIVSWSRATASDSWAAAGVNPDPVLERPAGLHPAASEAMAAQLFLFEKRLKVAVLEELAAARGLPQGTAVVTWPLRVAHTAPLGDGAVALVLSTTDGDAELAAVEWGMDHPDPTRRHGGRDDLLSALARRAYARAGITPDACTVVETTDRNIFRLLHAVCGLDLATPAGAAELIIEGGHRVNRSGGLWVSNPEWAAGLERVVEAVRAVRSGDGPVVAHASYGRAGQGQLVSVVREAS